MNLTPRQRRSMNLKRRQRLIFALIFAVALLAVYFALGSALETWHGRWGVGEDDGPSGHWSTPLFRAGTVFGYVIIAPALFVEWAMRELGITTSLAALNVLHIVVFVLVWAAVAYWWLGRRWKIAERPLFGLL